VMNGGKLEQVAVPAQAYSNPVSRFVAGFLGEVNWMGDRAVRPERTRIEAAPSDGAVPCRVVHSMFLGGVIQVEVECAHGSAAAHLLPHQTAFAPGDAAYLSWHRADELPLSA